MRDIKFRAWDEGKMVGPYELGSVMAERYCVDIDDVEQFAGAQYLNGEDIYEGDKVKLKQHIVDGAGKPKEPPVMKVSFHSCRFCLKNLDDTGYIDLLSVIKQIEKIGTIHD